MPSPSKPEYLSPPQHHRGVSLASSSSFVGEDPIQALKEKQQKEEREPWYQQPLNSFVYGMYAAPSSTHSAPLPLPLRACTPPRVYIWCQCLADGSTSASILPVSEYFQSHYICIPIHLLPSLLPSLPSLLFVHCPGQPIACPSLVP